VTSEVEAIRQQLITLAQQCAEHAKQHQQQWYGWADPAAVSPAQYGEVHAEQVAWWPVVQQEPLRFEDLERGLEMALHPAVKAFYSALWGGELQVRHPRGDASLLLLWHADDFVRLQQNIIGHVLMKRRLKQRETVFIAVTDEEDMMLSILNSSGEVYLEQTGREVSQLIAPDLASFIAQLQPVR
jgi:SecY interacting protein Syd